MATGTDGMVIVPGGSAITVGGIGATGGPGTDNNNLNFSEHKLYPLFGTERRAAARLFVLGGRSSVCSE